MAAADPQPKKRNLKHVGVVAFAVVLAGLLCWWPWRKPSSNTPTPQHSVPSSALRQPGSIFTNSIGGEMVFIPAGEFMIGSTPEERAQARAMGATETQVENEGQQPRRSQIRNGFWIGRTEVTVDQWQQFVNDSHYQSDAVTGLAVLDSYPEKRPEDHPMAWVTWSDTVMFCEWLTQREQRTNRLPERYTYRLPSEAEWEYACRAGRKGTMFWWGDSPADGSGRLNWREISGGAKSTSPVDAFGMQGRNSFGLADTLGNVRELCLDAWDASGAAADFCADYTRSKGRVLKGGSYRSLPFDTRCARRWPCLYSYGSGDIGFRVACGVNLSNETARVLMKLVTPGANSSPSGTPPSKKSP
ncbi:MAG: formylglycine-generating enzyme family protein [Verrucomicrobiia bacterium]